jgi:hypothetical protein
MSKLAVKRMREERTKAYKKQFSKDGDGESDDADDLSRFSDRQLSELIDAAPGSKRASDMRLLYDLLTLPIRSPMVRQMTQNEQIRAESYIDEARFWESLNNERTAENFERLLEIYAIREDFELSLKTLNEMEQQLGGITMSALTQLASTCPTLDALEQHVYSRLVPAPPPSAEKLAALAAMPQGEPRPFFEALQKGQAAVAKQFIEGKKRETRHYRAAVAAGRIQRDALPKSAGNSTDAVVNTDDDSLSVIDGADADSGATSSSAIMPTHEKLPANIAVFTAALDVYRRNKLIGFEVLDKLDAYDLKGNCIIYTSLIRNCIAVDQLALAWRTYDYMRIFVAEPDEVRHAF